MDVTFLFARLRVNVLKAGLMANSRTKLVASGQRSCMIFVYRVMNEESMVGVPRVR